MWAEVKRIASNEVENLNAQFIGLSGDDLLALRLAADRSDPVLAAYMGEALCALVGFIPLGLISGTAYAWLQPTQSMSKFKISFVRVGRAIFAEARKRYPIIYGHCSLGPRSEAWLQSCGARFLPTDAVAKPYVIGDIQ
jgi:hypothetical protein